MTTSAMRSMQSVASTSASPNEPPPPRRCDARDHRTRGCVPALEDRRLEDAAHLGPRAPRLVPALARDHGGDGLADGVALEVPARGTGHPRPTAVAHARVLHRLYRRPSPADVDRRGRDAHLRD